MNCNECAKINPMPQCIETGAYSDYYLTGLVFDSIDTDMYVKVRDASNGRVIGYWTFLTEGDGSVDIDVYNMFPLMASHIYTMHFFTVIDGNPAQFTITNTDGTTSAACCLQFSVNEGQTDTNNSFAASTQTCATA
jgi:hypothetical protein